MMVHRSEMRGQNWKLRCERGRAALGNTLRRVDACTPKPLSSVTRKPLEFAEPSKRTTRKA
jgi:hypothetical protein